MYYNRDYENLKVLKLLLKYTQVFNLSSLHKHTKFSNVNKTQTSRKGFNHFELLFNANKKEMFTKNIFGMATSFYESSSWWTNVSNKIPQ